MRYWLVIPKSFVSLLPIVLAYLAGSIPLQIKGVVVGNSLECLVSPMGALWLKTQLDITQFQYWKLHLLTRDVQLGLCITHHFLQLSYVAFILMKIWEFLLYLGIHIPPQMAFNFSYVSLYFHSLLNLTIFSSIFVQRLLI